MTTNLYSLRMRSTGGGEHLSGAERLVPEDCLEQVGAELIRRGMQHSRGKADGLQLKIDLVPSQSLSEVALPDVTTWLVDDVDAGRAAATEVLTEVGVTPVAARTAIEALATGAAPGGGSMRGAMLVDVRSGQRLEADQARGVRVSRMDLSSDLGGPLGEMLHPHGLDNNRVREALVLAAKVMSAPGVVAELCWSDDPDYQAGYVAAPQCGYVRFPFLKPLHDRRGGRAFFVDPRKTELPALITYLQQAPVLATKLGACLPPTPWSARA